MATFSPTITNNTTPAISNKMTGNTTYAQFKNSLGQYCYLVDQAYLFTDTLIQIQGNFTYSKYDSSGSQNLQSIIALNNIKRTKLNEYFKIRNSFNYYNFFSIYHGMETHW